MDIIMPQLGETVTEGTVSAWHKKPGDRIKADEALFDVETEKVSMEIPSPVAGVLREIMVEVGTTVPVGTPVAIVDTGAPAAVTAPPPANASPANASMGNASPPNVSAADVPLSPVVRRLLQESRWDRGWG